MLATNSSCAHPAQGAATPNSRAGGWEGSGPFTSSRAKGNESDFYLEKQTQTTPLCSFSKATCTRAPME